MWAAIFLGGAIVCIIGFFYIWGRFAKFKIIEKIAGDSKKKKRLISLVPMLGIAVFFALNTVPAAVAFFHLIAFWLACDGIGHLLKKKLKKELPVYLPGICALLINAVYLTIAWYLCTFPVASNYIVETDKLQQGESFRVVMFSDSHIGCTWGGDKLAEYIHEMGELNPDILVIVGDYIDDSSKKEEILKATAAFKDVETTCGIYYVFGNHDKGYYGRRDFTGDDLVKALTDAGVEVLEDEVIRLTDDITLVGRQDASNKKRAGIAEITKDITKEEFMIILDHQPTDQKNEIAAGADLVLSGHTHGGQLLPINYLGEIVGLNDQTLGKRYTEGTSTIVSSGISCWAIPFKTGCRSDYSVIDIVGTAN